MRTRKQKALSRGSSRSTRTDESGRLSVVYPGAGGNVTNDSSTSRKRTSSFDAAAERRDLLRGRNRQNSLSGFPETVSSTPPSPRSHSRCVSPSSTDELYVSPFEPPIHDPHSKYSFSAARIGVRKPTEFTETEAYSSGLLGLRGSPHTAVNHAAAAAASSTDYAPTRGSHHWGINYRRDSEPCIYAKVHDTTSVKSL